ncbi:hypothetical protein BCR43DRAFT_519378 [Syncephalastrum racemosum]|uniref:Uncharacterized protein n=1 Tax=Syncephalastrum racemosum TaxID=13706 RepID=A0A1X2H0B7_SYNRA|nr:hypothetical protein BCR43DRAFT_519378 [Syncephalastrum racemosum]
MSSSNANPSGASSISVIAGKKRRFNADATIRRAREKLQELYSGNVLKVVTKKAAKYLVLYAYGPETSRDDDIRMFVATKVLRPLLLEDEHEAIEAIKDCRSPADLARIESRLATTGLSPRLQYIKTAISHMSHLWDSGVLNLEHGEDWFRVNVYGPLWDAAFLDERGYVSVRAENKPLLQVGRKLDTTRVDFIYRHPQSHRDVLFGEEKKDQSGVPADLKKSDTLRSEHLYHWSTKVAQRYKDVASRHLESISVQWAGLQASVYGSCYFTVRSSGSSQSVILHYLKHRFAVPASRDAPLAYEHLGECLVAAITLQRHAVLTNDMLTVLDAANGDPEDLARTHDSVERELHEISQKYFA